MRTGSRFSPWPRRCAPVFALGLLVISTACRTESAKPAGPATEVESPSPVAVPAGQPLTNTVRWSVGNEVEIFGYDVFRGVEAEGPFHRVTETPVLKASDTGSKGAYEWVDTSIDEGQPYWYYVEGITTEGYRAPVTPIQKAPPKVHVDSGEEG